MKIKVFFWNINEQYSCSDFIRLYVEKHKPDVIFLAETSIHETNSLAKEIDFDFANPYISTNEESRNDHRVRVLINKRISIKYQVEYCLGFYGTAVVITINETKFIVIGVHFLSQIQDEGKRITEIGELPILIKKLEKDSWLTENTCLIGDFNFNPWDKFAINKYYGFNAFHDFFEAEKNYNPKDDRPSFYNVSWNLISDGFLSGNQFIPPSTYYYYNKGENDLTWNCYDGVMIRPGMTKIVEIDSLEIVTEITGIQPPIRVLPFPITPEKRSHPVMRYSDHFPIQLTLNFPNHE